MNTHRFCTEHSRAAGELLAGWGGHQARNILLRWPKAKWRHSLRIADGMDRPLEDAIARVVDAGWRVNLIDRKPYEGRLVRAYIFPGGRVFDLERDELPAFLDAVVSGSVDRFEPGSLKHTLVLCCTHGKHDRCCAKWGFAVYKAVASEALKRGDFDVWEATHLGGCRLSAGVLTFPGMRKYGRLAPIDAKPLLDAEAQGRPYLPNYRGASHLEPAAQVAEITALKTLGTSTPPLPDRVTELAQDGLIRRFAVEVLNLSIIVACRAETVSSYGACEDLDAALPLEPKEVWLGEVRSITRTLETAPWECFFSRSPPP